MALNQQAKKIGVDVILMDVVIIKKKLGSSLQWLYGGLCLKPSGFPEVHFSISISNSKN